MILLFFLLALSGELRDSFPTLALPSSAHGLSDGPCFPVCIVPFYSLLCDPEICQNICSIDVPYVLSVFMHLLPCVFLNCHFNEFQRRRGRDIWWVYHLELYYFKFISHCDFSSFKNPRLFKFIIKNQHIYLVFLNFFKQANKFSFTVWLYSGFYKCNKCTFLFSFSVIFL